MLVLRTASAAIAPATAIGHKGEVAEAKVPVGTILDLLESPELVQRVSECFLEENKVLKYEPLPPPDTRPDVELNKAPHLVGRSRQHGLIIREQRIIHPHEEIVRKLRGYPKRKSPVSRGR